MKLFFKIAFRLVVISFQSLLCVPKVTEEAGDDFLFYFAILTCLRLELDVPFQQIIDSTTGTFITVIVPGAVFVYLTATTFNDLPAGQVEEIVTVT